MGVSEEGKVFVTLAGLLTSWLHIIGLKFTVKNFTNFKARFEISCIVTTSMTRWHVKRPCTFDAWSNFKTSTWYEV